jgi:hypothetical protein
MIPAVANKSTDHKPGLLRFGPEAQVQEPSELRAKIAALVAGMKVIYG